VISNLPLISGEIEVTTVISNLPLILGLTIPAIIIIIFLGVISIYFYMRFKNSNPNLDEPIDLYTIYF